jgi:hypothetical protein
MHYTLQGMVQKSELVMLAAVQLSELLLVTPLLLHV